MNILNCALLQLAPCKSLNENLEKGLDFCRKAKQMGADIALFPEMFSCGYDIYDKSQSQLQKLALEEESPFVTAFCSLSKALDMAIGITYLEKHQSGARNSLTLFDRHGKKVFTYAKVHTCDFGGEKYLARGDSFYTSVIDTAKGNVNVGAMICYDREFPESARILMLGGAELILVPNACPMEINRLSQLRGRAYENMLGIATCSYPSSVPDCNGHSNAFDGVAYLPSLSGSRDTCILEADENEGIFIARFDLDMIREYRKSEVHGNAYRRPSLYKALCDTKVDEPFTRDDARR